MAHSGLGLLSTARADLSSLTALVILTLSGVRGRGGRGLNTSNKDIIRPI